MVIVLDQITKQLADTRLQLHVPHSIIDGSVNFTLMYNKGAAFSFLSDAGGWQRWFFMVLSTVISVVLFVWLKKVATENRLLACGLALILGGAVGNLIDRVLFGHVIDFFQYYYAADSCLPGFTGVIGIQGMQCYYPAFNIADSAIFLGASCLIADMIRDYKKHA